jgi:hypothetical protein
LGAWLLRALAVSGDDGRAAIGLLARPHPQVTSAVALWTEAAVETDALAAWRGALAGAATGPIPTPAQADAWADRATGGLLPAFPLALDDSTCVVLANALACRVTWPVPLAVVDGAALGDPFSSVVPTALSTGFRTGQRSLLAQTRVGVVGVHVAESEPAPDGSGLSVVSVVAADGVPPTDVHATALDVAAMLTGSGDLADTAPAQVVSVTEAPAEGHCWSIEDGTTGTFDDVDVVVRTCAVLPAWSALTDLDLLSDVAFGVADAVDAITSRLPPETGPYSAAARQTARAGFSRTGFQAAAISAMAVARSAAPAAAREVPMRTLTVRFGRPYAVCAVATGTAPWHGVPVFSAWVAAPEPVG